MDSGAIQHCRSETGRPPRSGLRLLANLLVAILAGCAFIDLDSNCSVALDLKPTRLNATPAVGNRTSSGRSGRNDRPKPDSTRPPAGLYDPSIAHAVPATKGRHRQGRRFAICGPGESHRRRIARATGF